MPNNPPPNIHTAKGSGTAVTEVTAFKPTKLLLILAISPALEVNAINKFSTLTETEVVLGKKSKLAFAVHDLFIDDAAVPVTSTKMSLLIPVKTGFEAVKSTAANVPVTKTSEPTPLREYFPFSVKSTESKTWSRIESILTTKVLSLKV